MDGIAVAIRKHRIAVTIKTYVKLLILNLFLERDKYESCHLTNIKGPVTKLSLSGFKARDVKELRNKARESVHLSRDYAEVIFVLFGRNRSGIYN